MIVSAKAKAKHLEWKKARQKVRRREEPEYREKEIALNHKNKLRRIGMTPADYQRMHDEQNGVCKICLRTETVMKLGRIMKLAVDHDHVTGKIRGCCVAPATVRSAFSKIQRKIAVELRRT